MKFHPFCEAFPLIEGDAFDELVADIKVHGLREEILTFGGLVLDGRNRARACQKANIQLRTKPFIGTEAQARSLVVSANVHRRHLTASQRAFAFAELAKWATPGNQPKGEPGSPPPDKVLEIAAEAHVSDRTMQQAKAVAEKGSKRLKESVRAGDLSIKKAAAVLDLPKAEQLAAAKTPKVPVPDGAEPDDNEEAVLELAAKERETSLAKILAADDKLAAAATEIKRQASEIAALKVSRDGFMNGKAALEKLLATEQRKTARLEKRLAELEKKAA